MPCRYTYVTTLSVTPTPCVFGLTHLEAPLPRLQPDAPAAFTESEPPARKHTMLNCLQTVVSELKLSGLVPLDLDT